LVPRHGISGEVLFGERGKGKARGVQVEGGGNRGRRVAHVGAHGNEVTSGAKEAGGAGVAEHSGGDALLQGSLGGAFQPHGKRLPAGKLGSPGKPGSPGKLGRLGRQGKSCTDFLKQTPPAEDPARWDYP